MEKAKIGQIALVLALAYVVFFPMGGLKDLINSVALNFISLDDVLDRREDYLDEKPKKERYKDRYEKRNEENTIKVLIVPGHDDEFSGTAYKGTREVDLNRKVAQNLYELLDKESGMKAVLASSETGYTKELKNYFEKERDSIQEFIKDSKNSFREKVANGEFSLENKNFHNFAPGEMVYRLYGINQWVNEEEFDLVVHIHFNDYAGRRRHSTPKYNGFAIYVPDKQFGNYELSKNFADKVLNRLDDFVAISNLPPESGGVVEDNELIAIGANETLSAGVILVEYGYIYEKQFTHPDLSDFVLDELAWLTYAGIKDMFDEKTKESRGEYVFQNDLSQSVVRSDDNLKLQYQLSRLGKYPPKGKTLNNCPIAGYFGECTKQATKNFQREHGLPITGYVGKATREVLNSL
jgi:peptidoglycan hydrolase-like protein with peptidoglycan-binding domain